MFHKIEECSRCFTLMGRGFWKKRKLKRSLKQEGHIIFEEKKLNNGAWALVVSTKTYKGAIANG